MSRLALPLTLLFACTGTPSATEGAAASVGVGGGGQGAGMASGGAGGADGGAPPATLTDRGLLVRYFLDEAARGTAPTELADAADNPLDLPLTYDDEMTFGERDGQRGLVYADIEGEGFAGIPIADTKILPALGFHTEATIEVVVALDDVTNNHSRLLYIGQGTESGRFGISAPLLDRIYFYWRGYTRVGAFHVALGPERAVVHAVLDTTAPPELRVRAYLNGSPAPRIGGTTPDEGTGIELDGDEHLVIGNRPNLYRTPKGAILYAALYSVALSDEEVLQNTKRLLASDDTQP